MHGDRSGALDRAGTPGSLGHGGVPGGARLLHGERAVGCAEPQRPGQRRLALAHLRAAVDVEQPDRLQQSPAPSRNAASTSAAGTVASTTSATSWVAGG